MPEHCHNKGFIELRRETSKYNKYMKWRVITYREDMTLLASEYYRTRKKAEQHIETSVFRGKHGFPIGNRLSFTDYTMIF